MTKHIAVLLLICGLVLIPGGLLADLLRHTLGSPTGAWVNRVLVGGSAVAAMLAIVALMIAAGGLLSVFWQHSLRPDSRSNREQFPLWAICNDFRGDSSTAQQELLRCVRYTIEPKLSSVERGRFTTLVSRLKNHACLTIPESVPPAVCEMILKKAFLAQSAVKSPPIIRMGRPQELFQLDFENTSSAEIRGIAEEYSLQDRKSSSSYRSQKHGDKCRTMAKA